MKEMVGGCCVCSDERGWTENPLVYCDGANCTVAVHQACYGIVTVPSGPWYCRKCESQENAARVRCELCPSRDGALKKTDINAWAHVVCALYIPEVRFGNVTTMEPIVLSQIPHERFNKTCYICDEAGKGSRASIGACMQCNKAGCKQQFHVTCAQSLGLLCEEAGNYLDNVKYCGYCQHHYSKLKGGNVKTIPPYKPVNPDVSSDSSPEKELSDVSKPGPVKRKNSGKCSVVTTTSTSKPSKVTETLDSNRDNSNTSVTKFTTSNFVESVVTNSESVFGADAPVAAAPRPSPSLSAPHPAGKKRKSGNRTPTLPPDADANAAGSAVDSLAGRVVKTELVQPSEPDLAVVKLESHEKKSKIEAVPPPPPPAIPEPVIVSMKTASNSGAALGQAVVVSKSNVIASTGCAAPMPGIVVSVPLAAAPTSVLTTAPTLFQQLQQSIVANSNAISAAAGNTALGVVVAPPPSEPQPAKRRRSQSSDKPEKGRKNKRNCTPPTPAPPASTPAPAAPAAPKRSSRSNLSTPTPPPAPIPPIPMQRSSHPAPGTLQQQPPPPMTLKESPPSSPGSEAASASHGSRRNKKKNQRDQQRSEPKDVKIFSNGVSAPHMLGNQLNPSSNMSKKLSDALSAELEAHSVFTDSSTATSALVGPQLHSRVIASVRSGAAAAAAANSANNPLSMGLGAAFAATASGGASGSLAAIPQSLDQLLERQWEQGSQFLMEQAQHFDIASLLSCLHQLRAENLRLEEHVNTLLQRRDHLLAVNARLAIPLTTQPPGQVNNNVHPEPSPRGQQRLNNSYPPHPLENGLDSVLYPSPHRSPSTGPNAPAPNAVPPGSQGRGGASAPDNRRISNAPSGYPTYGVNAPGPPQLSAATTQAIHAPRRDAVTDLHSMQSSKHS